MKQLNWGELTPALFLEQYWQKKPLLIKNAFSNFEDPISADELAGLAMEQEIESRIISQSPSKEWQVSHGPFESFEQFGESYWTLLVQAVNNWSAQTHALLSPFRFIPNWRIDDIMVSFSTPRGGVGAHLDQYDVFIIQGEGKRHWQIGAPDPSLQALLPHPDLKQVSDFTPVIDVITEPGDLLYIPPNHPHNGYAIENSLNYSIGFQAPNSQDLWSGFADKLLDEDSGTTRLNDADRQPTESPEVLSWQDIGKIKSMMLQTLDNEAGFNDFVGRFLTQSHHALEILIPVTPISESQLAELLDDEQVQFIPVSGIKALLIESPNKCLYINGESIPLDEDNQALASVLAKSRSLTAIKLKGFTDSLKNKELLSKILNKGYWYIE